MGHLDGLCAVGLDPELWKWTIASVLSRDAMQRYVQTAIDWQTAGTALPYATLLRTENRVIGCTRFANIDTIHRRAEIGWTFVAKPWQRTAANTEAKYLMFRHGFEAMDCLRVELKTDVLNQQSRKAILRIGAKEEGVLRSHQITETGRVRDSVYYSVIASEWPGVKAVLEQRLATS